MSDTNFGELGTVSQMKEKKLGEVTSKKGRTMVIELAVAERAMFREAVLVDKMAFGNNQGISINELKQIVKKGALLLMRQKEDGKLVGHSQILFHHIRKLPSDFTYPTGYCYGTGVLPDFQGEGLGMHLARYQESIGRQEGIIELFLTVRVENDTSLRLRLGMGYEIRAYDPKYYGPDVKKDSRLILRKELIGKGIFPPKKELPANCEFVPVKFDKPEKPEPVNLATHHRISKLIRQGYIGVGINCNGLFFAAMK